MKVKIFTKEEGKIQNLQIICGQKDNKVLITLMFFKLIRG